MTCLGSLTLPFLILFQLITMDLAEPVPEQSMFFRNAMMKRQQLNQRFQQHQTQTQPEANEDQDSQNPQPNAMGDPSLEHARGTGHKPEMPVGTAIKRPRSGPMKNSFKEPSQELPIFHGQRVKQPLFGPQQPSTQAEQQSEPAADTDDTEQSELPEQNLSNDSPPETQQQINKNSKGQLRSMAGLQKSGAPTQAKPKANLRRYKTAQLPTDDDSSADESPGNLEDTQDSKGSKPLQGKAKAKTVFNKNSPKMAVKATDQAKSTKKAASPAVAVKSDGAVRSMGMGGRTKQRTPVYDYGEEAEDYYAADYCEDDE